MFDEYANLLFGSPEKRAQDNFDLGIKFKKANELRKAAVFFERAWILSQYDLKYANDYYFCLVGINEIYKAKDVLKQAVFKSYKIRNWALLLDFSQFYHTHLWRHLKIDQFDYDFEALDHIKNAAAHFAGEMESVAVRQFPENYPKIRLCYYLFGIEHPNSAIMLQSDRFIYQHDREKFDLVAVVPRTESFLLNDKHAAPHYKRLKESDIETIFLEESAEPIDRKYLNIAKKIKEKNIDILITMAGLVEMHDYFVQCLKPAKKLVSMIYSTPAIYCNPDADLAIAASENHLMELTCPSMHQGMVYAAPDLTNMKAKRSDYGIPEDAVLLVSGGREGKYRSDQYWRLILELMQENPQVWFLGIGLKNVGPEYAKKLFPAEMAERLVFTDWLSDYFGAVSLGDIYVDSFPEAGGLTILDAMFLEKPVTPVKPDILDPFGKYSLRPSSQYAPEEMRFDINNLSHLKATLNAWIKDKNLREEMGRKGKAHIPAASLTLKQNIDKMERALSGLLKKPSYVTQPNKNPFFSVLVPTYNQAGYLGAALDSILAQTFSDFEIIVVNDGSTDNTEEVMKKYAELDARIRIFSKPNRGAGSALNHGLKNASGKWISWLSSDDLYLPYHLELRHSEIRQNPEVQYIYSIPLYFSDDGHDPVDQPSLESLPPLHLQTLTFLYMCYVNGITMVAKKELLEAGGGFCEYLKCSQDYATWTKLSMLTPFTVSRVYSTRSRVHPAQTGKNFPIGCVLDPAYLAMETLNKHRFSDYVKFADLNNQEHLTDIVGQIMIILLDDKSIMVRAGMAGAFACRLCQWLTEDLQPEQRAFITSTISARAGHLLHLLAPESAMMLKQVISSGSSKFDYKPCDPKNLFLKPIEKIWHFPDGIDYRQHWLKFLDNMEKTGYSF